MEKIKTYVLMLSEFFPKAHRKAGMVTCFKYELYLGQGNNLDCATPQGLSGFNLSNCKNCIGKTKKLHTIRANYPLWEKRIKEIQEGHAVLSIRQWSGNPYRSKQVEIARLTAKDGVGIQKLSFDKDKDGVSSFKFFDIDGRCFDRKTLANNDGLSLEDWCDWFRGYDLSKPLAIIHFTKFRY